MTALLGVSEVNRDQGLGINLADGFATLGHQSNRIGGHGLTGHLEVIGFVADLDHANIYHVIL